jgi:hypothetical protein
MASEVNFRIRDREGQYSNFGLTGVDMSAANFDAQNTLITSLRTALIAIILGNVAGDTRISNRSKPNDTTPTSPYARREWKWLVHYSNVSTPFDKYTVEIPCPDAGELAADTKDLDLTDGADVEAFVTAFEAYVRPLGTQTVSVKKIELVGRDL